MSPKVLHVLLRLVLPLLLVLGACTPGGDAQEAVPTEPPRPGQCRMLTAEQVGAPVDDTEPVGCDEPHTAQTYATGTFPRDVAGDEIDDEALGEHLFADCNSRFRAFVGRGDESLVMRSTVTWSWFRPPQAAWDAGARWWRCDVVGGGEQSPALLELPADAEDLLAGKPDDRWLACADGPTVSSAPTVPCSQEHTWRAVTTIVLGDAAAEYPGDDVVRARTRAFCSGSVEAWLGYPVAYDYGYSYFGETEWAAGNRRSICWARTAK